MADAMAVLETSKTSARQLVATGGGANNMYWLTLIASLTDCSIAVPEHTDIGAAMGRRGWPCWQMDSLWRRFAPRLHSRILCGQTLN